MQRRRREQVTALRVKAVSLCGTRRTRPAPNHSQTSERARVRSPSDPTKPRAWKVRFGTLAWEGGETQISGGRTEPR